jgi:glutamate-5-semialdehyde dehydrogenase
MNANKRNAILTSLARLLKEHRAAIINANQLDVDDCPPGDAVILDRLKVKDAKVDAMIASVESVIAANDPVGRVISSHTREDGLRIENRQVPFGTILIIYEARPDVTIEAAIIALKAGNRILLKGGKESRNTNLCLAKIWRRALRENDVDIETVQYFDISREETQELVRGKYEKFDLVIPRGGEALIDFVLRNSNAPVIVSGRGNNFLYIDSEADFEMALHIAINGKQRLSVCNALDKILINENLPDLKVKVGQLIAALREQNIEVIGDEEILDMDSSVAPIEDEDVWFEEFLSAKIVIGLVASTQEAIDTINDYSGGHSAAIITANGETADEFLNEVDCAAVYHFRGPLGAEHLLTNKWFVFGDGHTRS